MGFQRAVIREGEDASLDDLDVSTLGVSDAGSKIALDTNQTIADTNEEIISFDSTQLNTDGSADLSGNQVVIQEAGRYIITGQWQPIQFSASGPHLCIIRLKVNGGNAANSSLELGEFNYVNTTSVYEVAAGDSIQLSAEIRGASCDVRGTPFATYLVVVRVG